MADDFGSAILRTDGGETGSLSEDAIDRSPFDEKVDAIATVLDELPPMQVLRAVQQLAEDSDALMEPCDVRTAAANISNDEELRSVIGLGETSESQDTDRNDAEWVKESVIQDAREADEAVIVRSGAWLAASPEGQDRVDVFRFDHSVDTETARGGEQP